MAIVGFACNMELDGVQNRHSQDIYLAIGPTATTLLQVQCTSQLEVLHIYLFHYNRWETVNLCKCLSD